VERIGRWLWQEHQEHFVVLAGLVVAAYIVITCVVLSIVVGSVFLHLELAEGVVWFAFVFVVFFVMAPVLGVTLRHRLTPVRDWARGVRGPEAATAAWEALLRLPRDAATRLIVLTFPVVSVATLPWVLGRADTDTQGTVGLSLAYVMVMLAAAMLLTTVAQMLFRPAVAEVGGHLGPVTLIEHGRGSARRRITMVIFMSSMLTGVVLSAAVLGGAATSNDYLVALIGSAVCAGYFCLVFDLGVLQPTMRPLDDVIEATVRVRRGDVRSPVPVSSLDELGKLGAAFNEMQRGLAERESLHAAFGSYVDPSLARRLVESGSSVFEGEDLVVTVLFADVRDFTSYAEAVDSATAVARLNRLFDVVVPVLHEHGGHANHYLGDGLLAVFGAPQPLERHADAAVAAAVEIQVRVRAEFGDDLQLGIGMNTGRVIAGTVGGGGRHEFTVIGDTVNVAARVEQLTKDTGDIVLITEATRLALSEPRPRSTTRGAFDLKGKTAAVTVHAVDPFPGSTR
jgi:adenylate cyclase